MYNNMKFRVLVLLFFIGVVRARSNNYTVIPKDIKLELIQVIFRHGERTSIAREIKELPYLNLSVYEPYGIGQLTNTGKEQMYNVGRALRERYNGYLSEKYLPEEVYAYSSEDDRTKMSLQLVLAGLFPPRSGLVWNPDLKWMPVPFRYTPKEVDVLMKPYTSIICERLSKEIRTQPEYMRAISRYSHTFALVRRVTGRFVDFSFPDTLIGVHNLLSIHERLGLPLPHWYTEQVKKDLRACLAIVLRFEAHTLKQRKLVGGPMIKTFLQNMNLNENLINPRKIYLYSGHDLTLNGLLNAYDIHDFDVIEFGTTLILEKLKDSRNKVYVRLLAYTPIDGKFISLRFGKCEEFCPVNDYLKHTMEVMPSDDEMNVLLNEFNVNRLKELFFEDKSVKQRLGCFRNS